MRARTVLLLMLALVLAGATAFLARSWLDAQRSREIAEAAPLSPPKPVRSVLVARADLRRGQILRPEDLVWQVWPEGGIDKNYVVMGGPRTPGVGVFLADKNDFAAMNDVYGRAEYFGDAPPARSTVEVARLPRDVLVEIEVTALA